MWQAVPCTADVVLLLFGAATRQTHAAPTAIGAVVAHTGRPPAPAQQASAWTTRCSVTAVDVVAGGAWTQAADDKTISAPTVRRI